MASEIATTEPTFGFTELWVTDRLVEWGAGKKGDDSTKQVLFREIFAFA